MPAKKTVNTKAAAVKKEDVVEETTIVEPSKPKLVEKKKFQDDDKIPCMSITAGKYVWVGPKSDDVYRWISDGDVVDVRYNDLVAAVRGRKPMVFKPRVVIQDDDFLAEYPDIQKLYDSMYSKEDLYAILQLAPNEMRRIIPQLPDGVKDSLKTLAVKAIDDGRLDSVQRVRVIDDIFGTDILLKLTS